ncbi:MAG: hypothetical protein HYU67_08715, partial [Flavobacteriia bacterium]|nr:hypothetical protein [Flavobacteriia bacterium]
MGGVNSNSISRIFKKSFVSLLFISLIMSYRSQITLDIGAEGTFCTDQNVDFTLDWNGFPDEGTAIVNYNLSFTEYNASDTFLLICGMNYTITASGFYSQWDEDFCNSPNPGLLHYRDNEYGYNNGVIVNSSIPNRMISPYGLLQPNET